MPDRSPLVIDPPARPEAIEQDVTLQNGIPVDIVRAAVDESTETKRTIVREEATGIETAMTIETRTETIDRGNQKIVTDKTVRVGPLDHPETIVIATTTAIVGKNHLRRTIVRTTTLPAAVIAVVGHRTIKRQDPAGLTTISVDQRAAVEASRPL